MKKIIYAVCAWFLLSACFGGHAQEKEVIVWIDTDMGKIKVKLYNETPQHRDNFIKLVEAKQYDGLLFHRVIKQFMIQAGDIQSKDAPPEQKLGEGNLDYTIPAEIVFPRYFHKRGQLCAARTSDDVNPEKASSATQFYIVTGKHFTERELDKMEQERNIRLTPEQREAYMIDGGAPHLDGSYTVFGEVIDGISVVDKIQYVQTGENDRPLKNIRIKSMKIVKK
jgi:peptidylprolyl isomerase/peptidyl-prolyl cis-trans isomerase B (cyclophilin B)